MRNLQFISANLCGNTFSLEIWISDYVETLFYHAPQVQVVLLKTSKWFGRLYQQSYKEWYA